MILTMSAVAENKGIEMGEVVVEIDPRIVEERGAMVTHFSTRIDLGPGLSRRERVILYNSARRCEVHKLLSGDISFDFELADA
jgi:uncharacterized OsmC-like protein